MFETQSAKEPHQRKTLAKFVAKLKLPKCKMNLSDPQLAKFILKTCILVGIITLVWAGYTYIAEPWAQPEKVRITNITSRSATVTWVTDVETKGMVIYSEKDNFWPSLFAKISKTVSYDDRDVVEARLESAQKESENLEDIDGSEVNYDEIDEEVVVEKVDGYYVHHVTLRSLEPEKTYYFMVGNGLRFSKVEVGANDGGDYTNSLMTYEELEDIPTPNPTYGKVVWESGSEINLEPASDALVYMQAVKVVDEEYSDLLSAVTGSNGSWYIDISNARSEETGELMTNFTDDDMEVISFDAGPVGSLEAFYNSMAKDAPADTFIVRISSGENEDESDDDSEESKVRNILVSEVEAGESECTAEGNTWCGGGSCPDGWSYGPGCWTGSGGCSERDSEACQSHQGSSSSTGTGSTSGSGTTGESSGTTGSVAVGEACTETYTEVQNGQTIQCTKHGIKQSNGECSWGSGSGCTSTRGSDGRCVLGGQVQTGCDGLTECASACFPGDQCTGGNGNTSCCTGTCSATSSSQESTGTGTSTGSGSSTAPTEPQDASCPAGARTNQNITHGECCGWVNTADCTCACSDGSTKQVAWGTKCNCTATTVCCVGLNEEDCNSAANCTYFGDLICGDPKCWPTGVWRADVCPNCGGDGQQLCGTGDGACNSGLSDSDGDGKCDTGVATSTSSGSSSSTGTTPASTGPTTPSTGPATPSVTCTDGCIVGGSCVSLGGSKTVGGTVYNCGHSGNIWKSCAPGYTALGDDPSAGCHRSSVSTSTSAPGSCSASDVPGCTNAAGQVKCTNGSFSANCLECPDGTWQVSTCFHNQVSTSQVRVQRTNHACSRVTGVSTSMTSVSINNGKDCKNAATGKWGKCSNGSCVVTSSALPMKGVSDSSSETVLGLRRYINEVRAESIMLSPSSGLYSFSENGVYCMDYDGSNYCFEILSPDNNLLYIDVDGDGSYTAGVDINIADDVVQIEVSLDRKKRMVSLSSGFNFISMDLVDISVGSHDFTGTAVGDTASTFLSRLNSTYGDLFYSIARFDSGWKVIGSRDGVLYGEVNDFQLIPGKGYLVKVKNDIVVEIYGREVIDPVPTFFNEGWNLVGIHGSTVDYTAESLIDAIDTVASLDADNVTKWEVDLSKYEGLQKEPDESGTQQVYGFDFPITDRMSYFVSIAEGSGTWTPD